VIALAICFPFVATKYVLTVAILGLIYVLLGLGLNIVVGLAGCWIWGMSPSMPLARTAWRWGISISAWASGACCRWRQ
jgi:ABC-type branched-subunit amino acid transport system permease subunit